MSEIRGDLCHELLLKTTKKLVVAAGKEDDIFPLHGVGEAFGVTQEIFERAGAKENCRLAIMPKDHYFCEDVFWNAVKQETEKLG